MGECEITLRNTYENILYLKLFLFTLLIFIVKLKLPFFSRINPEIKSAVFCTVLNSEYRMEIWNNMWTLFKKSNVAWEIETVLLSFGCTESVTLLKQ